MSFIVILGFYLVEKTCFDGLDDGLYIVISKDFRAGMYTYRAASMLILVEDCELVFIWCICLELKCFKMYSYFESCVFF